MLLAKMNGGIIMANSKLIIVEGPQGAGKTTTVAAKVRYLVEKKGVKPEQILVISLSLTIILKSSFWGPIEVNCFSKWFLRLFSNSFLIFFLYSYENSIEGMYFSFISKKLEEIFLNISLIELLIFPTKSKRFLTMVSAKIENFSLKTSSSFKCIFLSHLRKGGNGE